MVIKAGEAAWASSHRACGQASPGQWPANPNPLPGPATCPTCWSTSLSTCYLRSLTVQRPVIHPLSSPSNRFCVTSLDPDTLPAVATLLMDVMFYSNG